MASPANRPSFNSAGKVDPVGISRDSMFLVTFNLIFLCCLANFAQVGSGKTSL
jgi:hypothetical protein